MISAAFPYQKKRKPVLGLEMAYVDEGQGDPIVFLHGNPTYSYVWRNILPHVQAFGQVIAPDLIGMGDSQKVRNPGPDSYTFVEHRRYLDTLLEALDVSARVTFVGHDWGGALAFDWARRHPDAVKGIAFLATGETEETEGAEHPHALTCYVDGHRKPVYSDVLLPRGLSGHLGVVLGCRALLLLHDEHGHPLFVTTLSFDQHLTVGVPAFLERYEQRAGNSQATRMIVVSFGMATEFLASLHAEGRTVVTILQTTQYRDLSSFSDVGTFVPLSTDAHGQVIREVAPARIALSREDHPDAPLCLQVALIRDLRRTVLVRPDPEEASFPSRWDSDLSLDERTWWREGWQATAAPAKETTPIIDAIELAQTYIHRWPAQENIIKDYLLPLGLDTNHGFAKVAVENSGVAKRRARLEQRLARLKQWAQSAGKREARASRQRERLRIAHNQRSMELYQELWEYQLSLEEQNLAEYVFRRKRKRTQSGDRCRTGTAPHQRMASL